MITVGQVAAHGGSDDRENDRPTRWPARVYGVGTEPDPRFTLANERTFLAWLRTSLALMAAGVGIAAVGINGRPILRDMIATQAEENGASFVDTYTPSLGHDACQLPGTKWVEGYIPLSPAFPLHPNALGMAAVKKIVLDELR